MAMDNFYYNEQIKGYLIQFMAIFSDLKVKIGKRDTQPEQLISVPIQHGFKDRVVAAINSANTQNKPLRLPMLSAVMSSVDVDPSLRKGVRTQRRTSFLPRGEVFPGGIQVAHQMMPVPYRARTELSIYASNIDQMYQILEQILMVFDPSVQIQKTDELFDWTKLTIVELDAIHPEQNYPPGTDRRMIVWTLSFNFPIYLSAPTDLKTNFIKQINVRLGIINGTIDPSTVVADLDAQSVAYETWFDIDSLNLKI